MRVHRRVLSLLASLAVSLPIASHGATQQQIVKENIGKELDPGKIAVTLERTQCLGSCPAYRVRLTGRGEVEYEGKAWVKITGIRRATLPREAALKIVNELLRVRIFDAVPEYVGQDSINNYEGKLTLGSIYVTDMPSTYLELSLGGHTKRVHLYSNVPKELGAIPDLIDRTVNIEQWIGANCDRPRSPMGPARAPGECEH